jgi:hypothetical protein
LLPPLAGCVEVFEGEEGEVGGEEEEEFLDEEEEETKLKVPEVYRPYRDSDKDIDGAAWAVETDLKDPEDEDDFVSEEDELYLNDGIEKFDDLIRQGYNLDTSGEDPADIYFARVYEESFKSPDHSVRAIEFFPGLKRNRIPRPRPFLKMMDSIQPRIRTAPIHSTGYNIGLDAFQVSYLISLDLS